MFKLTIKTFRFVTVFEMTATKKGYKVEDVEMKDLTEKEVEVEKKDPNLLSVEDIREHCKLIRRSVETKETRFVKV